MKVLEKRLLKVFQNNPKTLYAHKSLWREIDRNKKFLKEDVIKVINGLVRRGIVIKSKGNKFGYAGKRAKSGSGGESTQRMTIEGVVDLIRSGAAYIISEATENDVYVPANRLGNALDGDRVRIKAWKNKRSRRFEGEVLEVVQRGTDEFAGIIKVSKRFAFLIADKQNMNMDLFIPINKIGKAKDGDKVLVKVTEWPDDGKKSPVAEVTHVLGKPGENNAEMLAILVDNGFPLNFGDEVMKAAGRVRIKVPDAEIAKRRDMRDVPTLTIDPTDAKDFDDALSIQRLDNGNWEVGVHIADVTHYVKSGSAMDKEAYERSTSVYLVDRVLPMFPEKISNRVCSLRPKEVKLCFSAIFELTGTAEVVNEWFGKTVIYSDRRFTYSDAQKVLDTGKGDMAAELIKLNDLAKKLREKRFQSGSIDFGGDDVRFILDKNGKPLEIIIKKPIAANLLIEDFMLLANKSVARFINGKKIKGKTVPSVNRVHASPDVEKLIAFKKFASAFGHVIDIETPQKISSSINDMLHKVKGRPEQPLLETLAVRTMAKAAYSTQNIGHYGLAFEHYVHFTSPIRRYPDVMIHRILQDLLTNSNSINLDTEGLERQCEHVSAMERKAQQAERASIKYKQVEYLADHLGEEFEGVISGVTQWGFFVELNDTKAEGLVRMESLLDDHYVLSEEEYAIVGYNKGRRFRLGDKATVRVVKTDLGARTVDFELL